MNAWWVPDAAGREVTRYCWVVEVEGALWALPLRSPRRDTPAWAFRRPYTGPALDHGKRQPTAFARLLWHVAGIPSEERADVAGHPA